MEGRELGTRVPKVKGLPKGQSCMSQGNVVGHEGAEGTKLACCKAMWPRHKGAKGIRLACCKTMELGTGVPKAKGMPKAQSLHVAR